LLGACASSGDYPSLTERPVERVEGSFSAETAASEPAPAPAPSADLVQRLAALRTDAETAHGAFTRAVPAAERLATASESTGSDSWASAQVALADLESLRSQAAVSLAELDLLWIDTTVEGAPRDAIAETLGAVLALVRDEDETLARLRGRVGA
jgi:hypothetical protein